jgi:serine protease AprX
MNRKSGKHVLRLLIILGAGVVLAQDIESKISPDLTKGTGQFGRERQTGPVRVIVQYNEEAGAMQRMRAKMAQRGGVLRSARHLAGLNMSAGEMFDDEIRELAKNPDIKYISPDREVSASISNVRYVTGANDAFDLGFTGKGIGVAVIDSGITPGTDFSNCQGGGVWRRDFVSTNNSDTYGHGTHVAGIVANNSCNDPNFRGIAPGVRLLALRVLDGTGKGFDSAVIAAIDYAVTWGKPNLNIRVINLSLGRPVVESYKTDPLTQAVERAWKAGIVVVVAAGNDGRNKSANSNGYATISSPGNDPFVITVGALNMRCNWSVPKSIMASYSSKGPTVFDQIVKPDIVAPGNRVVSSIASGTALFNAYPKNRLTGNGNGSYFGLSGTSMAAPVVAAAAALMLQKDPTLTPDDVKARLMKTANKLPVIRPTVIRPGEPPVVHDLFTVGSGLVDIVGALNETSRVRAGFSARSPEVVYNQATRTVQLASGTSLVWGDSTFPNSLVWGDSVLVGNNVATQGNSLVWGDSTQKAFSLIWGDSLVWGDRVPFSEAVSSDGENLCAVPGQWTNIGYNGATIAVGIDKRIMASTRDGGIFNYVADLDWDRTSGAAKRVAIHNNGSRWVIGTNDGVFRWTGTQWLQVGHNALDISAGRDGSIFAVSKDNNLWRYVADNNWVRAGGTGKLKKIAVFNQNRIYGIGMDDDVWMWNGTAWSEIGNTVQAMAVGVDGTLVVVNRDVSTIWRYNNSPWNWTQLSGLAEELAVFDANTIYAVGGDADANIYRRLPQ